MDRNKEYFPFGIQDEDKDELQRGLDRLRGFQAEGYPAAFLAYEVEGPDEVMTLVAEPLEKAPTDEDKDGDCILEHAGPIEEMIRRLETGLEQ